MTATLRTIQSGPRHPCLNMGLDEALLRSPASPPTLRLYRWSPAAVSLGYFQSSAELRALPGDHVLVRRLTGGGAIYHGDEITFALTLAADLLPDSVPASYQLIHDAVAQALREVGFEPHRPDVECPPAARPSQTWCFADPATCDVLSPSGRKLLGSAQRRLRRPAHRVLHHGSLVMRAPAATPFVGSVAEVVEPTAVAPALESALVTAIATALDLQPVDGRPTADETAAATALARDRYADPAFTHRR